MAVSTIFGGLKLRTTKCTLISVGIVERMKLKDDHDLVSRYQQQLADEKDREVPVMTAATWLHGFQYWSPYHDKELDREELDWCNK